MSYLCPCYNCKNCQIFSQCHPLPQQNIYLFFDTMNYKKIIQFILLSFCISWASALAMKLCNIPYGSMTSLVIIAICYMGGPAIATFFLQKFVYKESFAGYGWTIAHRKKIWFLNTPLTFIALIGTTLGVIALLGNTGIVTQFGRIDMSYEHFSKQLTTLYLESNGMSDIKIPAVSPALILIIILLGGIIGGSTLNLPVMFGEEFGWRGLMLAETRKMGFLKSNMLIGFVWGIWHAPIIMMGHNYPHHPITGIAMMCMMTMAIAPVFAWLRIRSRSILDVCMLHGMINSTATVFSLYIADGHEMYASIAGWAGVLAGAVLTVCICIFDKPFVKNYAVPEYM